VPQSQSLGVFTESEEFINSTWTFRIYAQLDINPFSDVPLTDFIEQASTNINIVM